MRGKNLHLGVADVLARMRRLEGTGTYSLEQGLNGGADPLANWPYYGNKPTGSADCIGVALWAQGMDRYQPQVEYYGGWVNTNSIFGMPELFTNVKQDFTLVQPGDLLVYPSYKDILGRTRYGHAMTVASTTYRGRPARKLSELEVVHCAQKLAPATRRTWGFAKGKADRWVFFRPVHRA